VTLSRKQMEQDILDVWHYKSGEDSCSSLYMGGMATAHACGIIGREYARDKRPLAENLAACTYKQIVDCHKYLRYIIKYMKEHPMSWKNNLSLAHRLIQEQHELLDWCYHHIEVSCYDRKGMLGRIKTKLQEVRRG